MGATLRARLSSATPIEPASSLDQRLPSSRGAPTEAERSAIYSALVALPYAKLEIQQ